MTEYNLNGILFKDIITELKNGRVTVKSNVENNTGADLEAQVVEVTVHNEPRTEKFVFQGHLQAMTTGGTDQFNETHETSELSSVGDLEFAQVIEIADSETDDIKYSNIKILNNGESKSTIFMWVENNTSDVIPTGYYNFTLVDTSGKEVIVLSKYIDEIAVGQEIQVVLSSDELDYTAIKKVSSFKMEKEPIDTEKLREDVDELQIETTGISNELDLVKEDVADLKTATGEIGTDIDTIKTDLTDLTNKESAFETATNKSISDLEKKHDKEVVEINTEISNLKTSDTGIKTDIVNIKEDINGVKEDTKSNADDITLLKNKQSTLETNLVTANTKIENNSKGITDINKDITSIKKGVAQNKTDIADLQNEVKDLQRTDLTVKSDIINLKETDKEIKDDVKTLSNKVTTLENKQTASTSDVSTLKGEVDQLKKGMGNVVDKNTEQTIAIADLKTKLGVNDEKTAENKSAIDTLKTDISGVKENVTELLKEAPKTQNKVTLLEEDIKDINDDLPTIKKGVENNTEYIKEVEEIAYDNKSRLDTLEPKVQENAANIILNKTAIENTETEVEAVKTNITTIQENIEGVKEDIDNLETKHDEDISNVDEKIGKQEDDLNEAQEEITKMVEDILNLADRVKALENDDPITPEDPTVPTSPSTLEKLVKAYLEEHINNLLCVIIPRHDTSSNWSLNDPILSFGEYGIEDDTHRVKRGDGVHKWADLDYETFGIENLIATTAAEISYDNKETGISKTDVQTVLDYLLENLWAMRQEVDLKEVVKNKAYKIDETKISDVTYPSTKAVYSYIKDLMYQKTLVPENPEKGTYSLSSVNGIMAWVTGAEDDHAQIIVNTTNIEDLQTRVTDAEAKIANLDVDAVEERLDDVDTEVATIKTSVEGNTSDINAVKTNITTINETIENISEDVEEIVTSVGEISTKVDTNTSNISTNTTNIAQNASDIADLQNSLTVATDDVNTNKDNIETLQGDVEGLKEASDNLQETVDGHAITIGNLESNLTTLQSAVNGKLDKVEDANVVYGTDENGDQTTYSRNDFGKVDTVNGIEPDENKNIILTGDNIKYHADTGEIQYITISEMLSNHETNIQVVDEALANETTNRTNADTALGERIDSVEETIKDIEIPEYSLTESTTTEGYAKTYSLTKDGTEIGTKINIPKDLVVKAGSVKVVETVDEPYEGAAVGDKYVDLELNDKNKDHIYIAVKDLVDTYTGKDGDKINVTVSANNEIEATIKTGTIEKTDLTSALQEEITNAGKVDKVNGVEPDTDKNVIIDASNIYVDKTAETKKTIKEVLDNSATNIVNGSATGSIRTVGSRVEDGTYKMDLYAFAEGFGTTASGVSSHAEGSGTTASKTSSHAEGKDTTASGYYAHAEGRNTTASGISSHAEGSNTTASGDYSHTEGQGTIVYSHNQHVQGKYNIVNLNGKYAHIVGNGTSDTRRSNAHTIDWSGNSWYQGDIRIGGTSYDDTNSKKVATEEYVNTAVSNAGSVNTINNISADTNKNVQIDASQINMDDNAETKTTVKAKVEALNTLVAEQASTITTLQSTITEQNEKIAAQDEEIATMKELIGDIKTVLEYINTGNTELEEVDGVLDQIIGNEG